MEKVTSLANWRRLQDNMKVSNKDFKAAVETLYPIALGSTEPSQGARSVLLSAYDREEYSINIPDLQKLRLEELEAALIVIRACVLNQVEPHTLIENGMDRFYQLVLKEEQENL